MLMVVPVKVLQCNEILMSENVTSEGEMAVELFIFSLMDSVQSMLCCSNKIIACFIINKHTNVNTDMGK